MNIPDSTENLVRNPGYDGTGSTPEGWTFVAPRAEIAPRHCWSRSEDGATARLVLSATGDCHAFGCWQGEANLQPGQWYRASVRACLHDIAQPHLSVMAQVARHFLAPRGPWQEETVLEQVFRHDPDRADYDGNKVALYLRAAATGRIEYSAPQVVRIPQPEHRRARVATVRFGQTDAPLTLEDQRRRVAGKLDQAGALQADIVALTEFAPLAGVPESEYGSYAQVAENVPDGPLCQVLAAKAGQFNMYVLAGNIERRGEHVFNTAVLFDRQGKLCGQYDKTHLTFPELTEGISCGVEYPVFDLDFGRIAIHICYDEWFPEIARYYAHQGAEILFLPTMGGKPITWRTRALDNDIYFVSASQSPPSMIISSSGAIIAETHDDGIACADLNLDLRPTNVYVDPTRAYGMPHIAPQLRYSLDDGLLQALPKAMLKDQFQPSLS